MTCNICCEDFGSKETILHYASNVPHEWHKECIGSWVRSGHDECPLRCGYRYPEKDFLELQDRIKKAAKVGAFLCPTFSIVCGWKTLVAATTVTLGAYGFSLLVQGDSDFWQAAAMSSWFMKNAISTTLLNSPVHLGNLANHPNTIDVANKVGTSAAVLVSAVFGGKIFSATGASIAAAMGAGVIKTAAISGAIGGIYTGMYAAWKTFVK